VRIAVDLDLCQGHTTCESEAPDVFSVPKRGKVTVLMDQVPEELRSQVELAVTYCPTHALSIREE
jgi:ferredoxin